MSKLVWDQTGTREYETGVKNGVLYPQGEGGTYPKGVAWNGLISVTESPSGAEATALYADAILAEQRSQLLYHCNIGVTVILKIFIRTSVVIHGSRICSAGTKHKDHKDHAECQSNSLLHKTSPFYFVPCFFSGSFTYFV